MFKLGDRIMLLRDVQTIANKVESGSVGKIKYIILTNNKGESYYTLDMDNDMTLYGVNGNSLMKI